MHGDAHMHIHITGQNLALHDMITMPDFFVREMLSPEKKPQDSAQRTSNTSSTVPVATLAARSSDAKGRLIE
eukprot:scaffold198983_cov33-Tisochrysis_lutea.AAC.1